MQKDSFYYLILTLVFCVVGAMLIYFFGYQQGAFRSSQSYVPQNFEECAAAGYPIAESYPRQCRVPNGRMFVEEVSDIPSPSQPDQLYVGEGCKVGGCSGELCGSVDSDNLISICIYDSSYACYKTARCEKQANGTCGWTQTAALKSCLQ